MIGFELTIEWKALLEKDRLFAKGVILPVAAQHDRGETFSFDRKGRWVMEQGFRGTAASCKDE